MYIPSLVFIYMNSWFKQNFAPSKANLMSYLIFDSKQTWRPFPPLAILKFMFEYLWTPCPSHLFIIYSCNFRCDFQQCFQRRSDRCQIWCSLLIDWILFFLCQSCRKIDAWTLLGIGFLTNLIFYGKRLCQTMVPRSGVIPFLIEDPFTLTICKRHG